MSKGFYRKEIKGNVYGKLKATGEHYRKNGRLKEEVECLKCGWKHYVDRCCLITNRCGCRKCAHMIHGMFDTRFYKIYKGLKSRCNGEYNPSYEDYGGRGIKCMRDTFEDFKRDMYDSYLYHVEKYGEKDTSIDRIDVNGNYCKENCRWATNVEQANNKQKKVGVWQFARDTGIPRNRVVYRYYYRGLSLEQIKEKFMTI